VYVGAGLLEGALKSKVAERGLEERVYFIPKVPLDDLMSYTASADVGIQILEDTCLNHSSTISNKVFEYMMAGTPVVASDFPEIRKVVMTANFGLLVNPASVDDIVEKIRFLVVQPELRAKMNAAARESARDWSWEAQESVL